MSGPASARAKAAGKSSNKEKGSGVEHMELALDGLTAVQGVAGAFLIDQDGAIVADSGSFRALDQVAPKIKEVFFSSNDVLRGDAKFGLLRFKLSYLVVFPVETMMIVVAARNSVSVGMLNVGLRVAALKIAKGPGAVSGASSKRVKRSRSESKPPPDAVGEQVVDSMRQAFIRQMGPSAKLLLHRELTNMKVTEATLRRSQYGELVAKLGKFVRDPNKRAAFIAESDKVLLESDNSALRQECNQLKKLVGAVEEGLSICREIVSPVPGLQARHEVQVQQALTDFCTKFSSLPTTSGGSVSSSFLTFADQLQGIQNELILAGDIQRMLTPGTEVLEYPAATVAACYRPSTHVGGDWWTVRELPDRRLLVMIADVTGHGLSCGILTGVAKAASDVAFSNTDLSCSEILRWMNTSVYSVTQKRLMITCAVSIVDPMNATFSISSAGHNFPYLIRDKGGKNKLFSLLSRGTPLGVDPQSEYETTTFELLRNDVIVWYTDGATECTNDSDEQFGDKRFRRLLTAVDVSDVSRIRETIFDEIAKFCGDKPLEDDLTYIVASVRGG